MLSRSFGERGILVVEVCEAFEQLYKRDEVGLRGESWRPAEVQVDW